MEDLFYTYTTTSYRPVSFQKAGTVITYRRIKNCGLWISIQSMDTPVQSFPPILSKILPHSSGN